MELLLVHDPRQTEVGNQEIGIIFWGPKQEILWLQIPMYNTMIVEICNGGESRSHQVSGVGLVIVTLSTNAIKQLASKR
jgi:hypothetical protein